MKKFDNKYAYDKAKYGNIIDWDRYSLKIDGKRVFLIGGEFHYWRIPDQDRWLDILKAYKGAGLNCIRIYFHWGYHSPTEGKYVFDGNRDVSYLLDLCDQVGLLVFVAAGPYICAETTAGGFPIWLLQKRKVHIRHMNGLLRQKFDEEYMKYCKEWFHNFIPHVLSHQRTENKSGCVIGFQIENEYIKGFGPLKTNVKYMEGLVQMVREEEITVPLLHNDPWPTGSWNGLVDLYGFDEYPVHAAKHPKKMPLEAWGTKRFKFIVDRAELRVRKFGPPASETPIFIPELQGGDYNHWTIKYGFDEIYDFFGSTYQKMLGESFAAQGVTIMSFYMLYGGTNYGAIGNTEVYTSYDYSACLREYGYQSDRLRHLRLFALLARSFTESFAATDLDPTPGITCSIERVLNRTRKSVDGTRFYFFRNFNPSGRREFTVTLADGTVVPKSGTHMLEPRDAFIAIAYHHLGSIMVKWCSLAVIAKGIVEGNPLLVVSGNGGELLLEGTGYKAKGTISTHEEVTFTRVVPARGIKDAAGTITSKDGKLLHLLCLSPESALTFNASLDDAGNLDAIWGPYGSFFTADGGIDVIATGEQSATILSASKEFAGFEPVVDETIPGMKTGMVGKPDVPVKLDIRKWSRLSTNWGASEDKSTWKPIEFPSQLDPLDHGYASGNVLYKCEFTVGTPEDMEFTLNMRHKGVAWVNGHYIGHHYNYGTAIFSIFTPGCMNGPDPKSKGGKRYSVKKEWLVEGKNTVFVLTESLGQGKQVLPFDDCRNQRGIFSAKFSKPVQDQKWFISGIDVTALRDPYNTSGLPGEKLGYHEGKAAQWEEATDFHLDPDDQVTWFKAKFKFNLPEGRILPLRVHLDGLHTTHVYVNGTYIGRYWGEAGPQHDFYIMDKLLKPENVLVLACWTGQPTDVAVRVGPYTIKPNSGNIDEQGPEFSASAQELRP
jgi:hypothetical protein